MAPAPLVKNQGLPEVDRVTETVITPITKSNVVRPEFISDPFPSHVLFAVETLISPVPAVSSVHVRPPRTRSSHVHYV